MFHLADNLNMCVRIVLFISLLGFVDSTEMYSSVAHLKRSFNYIINSGTAESLEKYVAVKEKQLEVIQKVVDGLKELSEEIQDPDFDLKHPLNAYRFIRNHSLVYNSTVEQLFNMIDRFEKDAFNMSRLESMMKHLPNQTDIEEIVNGIFRIQNVYDKSAYDLVFDHAYFGAPDMITANLCHYISERAITLDYFFYAYDWINLAVWLVTQRNDTTIPLHLLLEDSSVIAFAAGNVKEAMEVTNELLKIKPDDQMARELYNQYEFQYNSLSKEEKEAMETFELPTYSISISDKLCQGRADELKQQSGLAQHTLFCWYETNSHPLLFFQPALLEEVSRDPYLVLYHNFLTDREMSALKKYATPRLQRSLHLKAKKLFTSSNTRISKTAHIGALPVTHQIQDRIAALTATSLDSFQEFQVTNYGIGGRYNLHKDYFPQITVDQGLRSQRQSTFMIYLSDVKAGGATIFPEIFETIFPEAGKAVFWHNTFRNGSVNPKTAHAACPVIVGDKWISNEWILQHGNEFLQPCDLDRLK